MTRFICEARDQLGIASYLSIIEEVDENGNVELIVMPTYTKEDAYKFNDHESAEDATKSWLFVGLQWSIKEAEEK